MRRTITALLLLLNGVGAAGRNLRPPCGTCRNREQRNRRRCKVAIVSASCRSLARNSPSRKSGYTVFGNEDNEVPVESWRVDDLVIAKISGALGNRAAVKRISYHKEAFASLETLKLFRDSEAEVGQGVRTLVAGTRCARYLLVTRAYRNVGTSNQSIGGIGLLYDVVRPFS